MNSTRHAPTWPLLAGALAAASFVGMDATVKAMAPRYDAVQLTFLRFASGSLFAALLWLRWRSAMPQRADWGSHALRSVLLLASLLGYFHGLRLLPLAQAVAMSYLAPIFVSLLAIAVLGERPSRWIWLSLGFGVAGVGVSLWPELERSALPDAAARLEGLLSVALSTVAFSGVMVLARRQAQRDALWTILLVQNLLPTVLLAAPAALAWQPLVGADLGAVALMGAFATVGLLSLTWAFSHLEASRVAPLEYTSFVWAALLGYALFGEVPTLYTAASAALIVGGCLLLLRR
ncbi:MAG: DMT family transporter [Rubrivivax sp.]|nr:DMT family transporter [Rubrivivax sp.]